MALFTRSICSCLKMAGSALKTSPYLSSTSTLTALPRLNICGQFIRQFSVTHPLESTVGRVNFRHRNLYIRKLKHGKSSWQRSKWGKRVLADAEDRNMMINDPFIQAKLDKKIWKPFHKRI